MGHINISKNHHKLFLISLAILFVAMYVVIFQSKMTLTKINQKNISKNIYTSKLLNFKFSFHDQYSVSETVNTVTLQQKNKSIIIEKIYGYSNSTKEYIEDLALKNKLNISRNNNKTKYGFDVYDVSFGVNNPDEISYIKNIDTDTFVSISTSSPDLYNDLDQIAASFEYLSDTKE